MSRVLVTGASGFIGRHVLPRLVAQGFEVHAICFNKQLSIDKKIKWHRCNLLVENQVFLLMQQIKPRYLLHLAWETEQGKYWHSAKNYQWVQATLHLLTCFQNNGGERVVSAGSCAEYDWRYGYCVENVTPCAGNYAYSTSKIAMQSLQQAFSETFQISQAWGRVFFLFGSYENSKRLVPSLVNSFLQQKSISCNDSRLIRDFLFIEDAADAFVTLLTSEIQGAVNIASGTPLTIDQLSKSILAILGPQQNKERITFNNSTKEAPMITADIQKLTEQVKWVPTYSFEEALEKTIYWWRNQK